MNEPGPAGKDNRLIVVWLLVGAYTVLVATYLAGIRLDLGAQVSNVTLLLTGFIAAAAALWRVTTGSSARGAWLLFAVAGLAAAASHVAWTLGAAGLTPSWLLLLSYFAFTAGAAGALNTRERADAIEVGLDTALILGAAAVVVLRWAPAARETLQAGILATPAGLNIVLAPIAAIASLFFAAIALSEKASPGTVAIGAAALSFAVASLPLAIRGEECCRSGNPLSLAASAGWLFVAFAALHRGSNWPAVAARSHWRMRHLIAPAVALFIGISVVDAAWRPPLHGLTALAIGSLGVILALQLTQLLYATRSQGAERQELAESLRLIEISNSLTGATDLSETQSLVTALAGRLLNCKSTALLMLIDGGQSMELRSAAGLSSSVVGMRFPLEGSFTAEVIASGRPGSTDNSGSEPYLVPEPWPKDEARLAVAPMLCRGDTIGALACIGKQGFNTTDLELLGALADQAALAIENAQLFEQVHALSLTDPLTGLSNRRQLERDLGREFAAARRGRRLVAVMFDLNGFKAYNDRSGHLAGDQALRAFGAVLTTETRAMNLAARYGGDEFVALLADADFFGAQVFIQRVKQQFSDAVLGLGQGPLTVSAGLAEYQADMLNPAHLLAAADRALYESKGRRAAT